MLAVTTACSTADTPTEKPDSARVQIEGTAPNPLRLIVSTDFFETVDEFTGEVVAVFNTADTLDIGLPFELTVLTEQGSVLFRLTQPEAEPATVRMRAFIDGRQDYDQSATMSEGGTLEYRYVFLEARL